MIPYSVNAKNNPWAFYVHFPFCKKECSYCDFYFTIDLSRKEEYYNALKKEIEERSVELQGSYVDTIYLGGGTPSLWSTEQISLLLKIIFLYYRVSDKAEITVEINPDDTHLIYFKELFALGINRISLGIQSFQEDELRLMNRRHSVYAGRKSIEQAIEAGFTNISIDLIYNLPGSTCLKFQETLQYLLEYNIPHFSAYQLTLEPGTKLHYQVKKGLFGDYQEDTALDYYDILREFSNEFGYDHYEISNFAKPGYYSRHNTHYWKGSYYIGVGASAHSYNGDLRRWNTSNLYSYIQRVQKNENYFDTEILNERIRYNEFLLTRLRMSEGIEIKELKFNFSPLWIDDFLEQSQKFIQEGKMISSAGHYRFTREGQNFADQIIQKLFRLE